ncbi:RNA-directed DNA polymerase, eukaryota, reverse transcriptase zinc-binding domain protein [Tanacetum coccineum]
MLLNKSLMNQVPQMNSNEYNVYKFIWNRRKVKRRWVNELCNNHKVSFLGIQESKAQHVDFFMIQSIWGHNNFEYDFIPANGLSGGLICIWERDEFVVYESIHGKGFLALDGYLKGLENRSIMINFYAPQDNDQKMQLWNDLIRLKNSKDGFWFTFGDFNAVRYAYERLGTQYSPRSASSFNKFIDGSEYVDVKLGGRKFIRINSNRLKLSC